MENGKVEAAGFQTRLEFSGTGTEYFRIWIVNLLLTIATLGIYSAWAKVRRTRWFYQHTRLLGDNFDYHGKPLSILLGRIIVISILAVAQLFQYLGETYQNSLYLVLSQILYIPFLFYPILLAKAWRFRLVNTSWRGLRFSFSANSKTIRSAIWYMALMPLTLGLIWPLLYAKIKSLQYESTSYGNQHFDFQNISKPFYILCLKTIALFVLTFIFGISIFIGIFISLGAVSIPDFRHIVDSNITATGLTISGLFLFLFLTNRTFFKLRSQQMICSHLHYGKVNFRNEAHFLPLLKLNLINLILVLLTFGFYWPFAVAKVSRYQLQNIVLTSDQPLPDIIAHIHAEEKTGAIGDAMADFLEFDIGW